MTEKDQLSSTNVVSNAPRPTRISIPRTDRSLNFSTVSSTASLPRRFDVENKFVFRQFSTRWKTAREREGGGELNDF